MIGLIVALAAATGICLLIIRSSRPRRGTTVLYARKFSFLRRYTDRSLLPSLILGSIALGTLLVAGTINGGTISVGVLLGLGAGVLWRLGLHAVLEWGLALISLAAAMVDIAGLSAANTAWERLYAYLMLALLTACYVCGLFVGGVRSALSPRRILIYFAVVDVVVFIVSPAGAQISALPLGSQIGYLTLACGVAFVLAALSVDIVTVLSAAAVTVAAAILGPGYLASRVVVVAAAVLSALLISRLGRQRG